MLLPLSVLLCWVALVTCQMNSGYPGWGQNQQQQQLLQQIQQQRLQQQQQNLYNQQQQQNGYQQQNPQMNRLGVQQPANGYNNGYGMQQVQPTRLSLPNANIASKLSSTTTNGAQVDIKINGYSNPNLFLSNATTCACSDRAPCSFLTSNSNGQNACKFSFVTIISAVDQSVQYYSSDFFPFYGQLSANTPGNWSQAMSFQMTSKPVAIDVFVYHMGLVISQQSPDRAEQQLLFYDKLTLVDSFVADIYNYDATDGQSRTEALSGKLLGTSLSVTYSVRCINSMMGKYCNLVCNVAPPDPNNNNNNNGFVSSSTTTTQSPNINRQSRGFVANTVLCKDNYFGSYSQCEYTNGQAQVNKCFNCVYGVSNNGTCLGVDGIFADENDMVSYAFRTWTIVLGCLLGVAVLLILCLILAYCIIRNREREDVSYKTSAYPPAQSSQSAASRPLLDDEWTVPPRRTLVPPPPPHADHDGSRQSDESFRNTAQQNGQQRQEHQV